MASEFGSKETLTAADGQGTGEGVPSPEAATEETEAPDTATETEPGTELAVQAYKKGLAGQTDRLRVEVAVLVPLSHALTYGVPEALREQLLPGSRVIVPLGNRRILGVVLGEVHVAKAPEAFVVKNVVSVVEATPVVPPELLRFLRELASYYFAPLGDVLRLAMPGLLKKDLGRAAAGAGPDDLGEVELSRARVVTARQIQVVKATDKIGTSTQRGHANALLAHLRGHGGGAIPVARLAEQWSTARTILRKLETDGLVEIATIDEARDPYFRESLARDEAPVPTGPQAFAMEALERALETGISQGFLLHGVTGSGKTEVYLNTIAKALALGKGALVLVPEIALTPQFVSRFRARFGDAVSVLHSALSPRDRHAMWLALRRGEVRVAIGARSALFAPVPDLGLVIVDEEHDGSFKQEEGVRYHARDMALLRAHRVSAVCLLGSATPSMEAEQLARSGRIVRLSLPDRARESATLPRVDVVDLRRTGPGPSGDSRLSVPLHRAIEKTLAKGEQVILFLNRRGFAPAVFCDGHGEALSCPDCAVALTLHRARGQEGLRCHYCDFACPFTDSCPTCGSKELSVEGAGTERMEDLVARTFPDAKVGRLDRDVASGDKAEAIFEAFRAKKIDILVGTQMVAKGHDIANVTLVGVVNADVALSIPDFRASERAFQILVQVAGRSGRGALPGTVVLQTRNPKHPALVLAAAQDVHGFAEAELLERIELGYPPFSRLALVRIDAEDEARARSVAEHFARSARASSEALDDRQLDRAGGSGALEGYAPVDVLGPAPAPIPRLRNRFRFRVMLKSESRSALRVVLRALEHERGSVDARVRVVLDVDPVSML
jgi:primosomal protein N' (replication factor Y) (superfamily II helicase)